MNQNAITSRDALAEDAEAVHAFIQPFVESRQLLPRNLEEVRDLMRHGFVAEIDGNLVGCAAVEIYSQKLAEIQCLAVSVRCQGQGIGKKLVADCVQRANDENVLEVMAISSSEEFLRECGFDYSLPDQKRALFYQTREVS